MAQFCSPRIRRRFCRRVEEFFASFAPCFFISYVVLSKPGGTFDDGAEFVTEILQREAAEEAMVIDFVRVRPSRVVNAESER
jgi:hypothetical protein